MHGANMTSLRRLLMINSMGQRAEEYTATGNPAVFETNITKSLRQLLIPFSPVQSGTGDPSPDNIRPITGWTGFNVWHSNQNLLDRTKEYHGYKLNANGSGQAASAYSMSPFIHVKPGETYFFYRITKNGDAYPIWTYSEADPSTAIEYVLTSSGSGVVNKTYTIPEGVNYIRCTYRNTYNDDSTAGVFLYDDYQEYGYAEHQGTDIPVVFPAVGKNLFDKAHPNIIYGNFDYNNNVIDEYDDQRFAAVWIPCEPNTTYTVSKVVSKRFTIGTSTETTLADGSYIDSAVVTGNTKSSLKITTGSDTNTLWVYLYNSDAGDASLQDILDTLQIEEGSSATTYEPFNNTVYGGRLDLTTGVLTVEWQKITIGQGAQTWNAFTTDVWYAINMPERKNGVAPLCNNLPVVSSGAWTTIPDETMVYLDSTIANRQRLFIKKQIGTVQEFREWLNNANIYVAYPLAEPIEYQLTPQQLSTLIGDNVIWSDTNGENTIKYLKKG